MNLEYYMTILGRIHEYNSDVTTGPNVCNLFILPFQMNLGLRHEEVQIVTAMLFRIHLLLHQLLQYALHQP